MTPLVAIAIHPYDVYDMVSESGCRFQETGEIVDEVVPNGLAGTYTSRCPIFVINGTRYYETTSVPYKSKSFDNLKNLSGE